jgi:hypothetical protein
MAYESGVFGHNDLIQAGNPEKSRQVAQMWQSRKIGTSCANAAILQSKESGQVVPILCI